MKLEVLLYLFYIYLFLQVLFSGPSIVFIVNVFFKKYLVVKTYSTGLLLPFFIFYAKDFELKTSGFNKTDIVKLKVKKIFFWINPFLLLIGKVRIHNLSLIEPEMKYVNRILSIHKMKYMPTVGRIKIKSGNLKSGNIEIEDRTVFPIYKVNIENIELVNSEIDMAIPLRLIFDSQYGYCTVDYGDVLFSCDQGKGSLQMHGVTWGKLINLDILPIGFLKNKIDLDVSFSHDKYTTEFIGVLGQINRDPIVQETIIDKKKLNYKFQVDWKEYQMPFDLALKKMIAKLLTGVNYGGAFSLTVNIIAESISKILKKQ